MIQLPQHAVQRYPYLLSDGRQLTIPRGALYNVTDIFDPHFQRCFVIQNERKRVKERGLSQSACHLQKEKWPDGLVNVATADEIRATTEIVRNCLVGNVPLEGSG